MTTSQTLQQFVDWTKKKIRHHINEDSSETFFHEGQVWWMAFGKNVGTEMDGKKEDFHRPALILKKYNKHMCFVIPLTTQIKNPSVWYQVIVPESNKSRVANITQGRAVSPKRFLRKESPISSQDLNKIKTAFLKQFL